MKNALKTLAAFWSGFGLPACLEGCSPPDMGWPRLLWEGNVPAPMEERNLRAEAWFRGENAQEERAAFAARLSAEIPPGGKRLRCPGGVLVLRRGEGFGSLITDRTHPALMGLSLRVRVRNCTSQTAFEKGG